MNIFEQNPFQKSQLFSNPWTGGVIGEPLQRLMSPILAVAQDENNDENIILSWNIIPNANRYNVYIDNKIISVTNNTFDYTFTKNGDYEIFVRALGTGFAPSNPSNIVKITVSNIGTFLSTGINFILANLKRILIKK